MFGMMPSNACFHSHLLPFFWFSYLNWIFSSPLPYSTRLRCFSARSWNGTVTSNLKCFASDCIIPQ